MPQFRGSYRISYSDSTGESSALVDADMALRHWRHAIWGAMSYQSQPDTADGFSYFEWPERNAKNLLPRAVSVRRVSTEQT